MQDRDKLGLMTAVMGLVFMLGGFTPLHCAEPMIYPAKGQSPEQQKLDQQECRQWAMNQSGHDPDAATTASTGTTQGKERTVLKSAAVGAAVGGVGGSMGGEFGKGAAAGAAAGALVGGIKKRRDRQATAQTESVESQARAASDDAFLRAYTACLEGRGYTVK